MRQQEATLVNQQENKTKWLEKCDMQRLKLTGSLDNHTLQLHSPELYSLQNSFIYISESSNQPCEAGTIDKGTFYR